MSGMRRVFVYQGCPINSQFCSMLYQSKLEHLTNLNVQISHYLFITSEIVQFLRYVGDRDFSSQILCPFCVNLVELFVPTLTCLTRVKFSLSLTSVTQRLDVCPLSTLHGGQKPDIVGPDSNTMGQKSGTFSFLIFFFDFLKFYFVWI